MDIKELENRFRHHSPKPGQTQKYESIRQECLDLALYLVDQCPESRELSVSISRLEDVCFYANASIARREFES